MDNEQLEQGMRYARSVPSETPEGLPINSDIKVLAAEVERLRAENARLNNRATWITKEESDRFAETCGLRDEIARLRQEAQTARLALDVADKEVAALRAKARWSEERWPTWDEACRILMTEHGPETAVYQAARVLLDRVVELENQPPGAAT